MIKHVKEVYCVINKKTDKFIAIDTYSGGYPCDTDSFDNAYKSSNKNDLVIYPKNNRDYKLSKFRITVEEIPMLYLSNLEIQCLSVAEIGLLNFDSSNDVCMSLYNNGLIREDGFITEHGKKALNETKS